MYIVRMKQVTASEARKQWFRLLDEVTAGEVVVIPRRGYRVVVRLEEATLEREGEESDYSRLLRVPEADRADRWSWEWRAPGEELALTEEG